MTVRQELFHSVHLDTGGSEIEWMSQFDVDTGGSEIEWMSQFDVDMGGSGQVFTELVDAEGLNPIGKTTETEGSLNWQFSSPMIRLNILVENQATSPIQAAKSGEYIPDYHQDLERLFFSQNNEIFEDGVESDFSRELIKILEIYGNVALRILSEFILEGRVNSELASESLRWIGHYEDATTYQSRLWLLEQSLLKSSSARVRDGALLGIASLDDPNSIDVVRQAIANEQNGELREDLEQVLEQLVLSV